MINTPLDPKVTELPPPNIRHRGTVTLAQHNAIWFSQFMKARCWQYRSGVIVRFCWKLARLQTSSICWHLSAISDGGSSMQKIYRYYSPPETEICCKFMMLKLVATWAWWKSQTRYNCMAFRNWKRFAHLKRLLPKPPEHHPLCVRAQSILPRWRLSQSVVVFFDWTVRVYRTNGHAVHIKPAIATRRRTVIWGYRVIPSIVRRRDDGWPWHDVLTIFWLAFQNFARAEAQFLCYFEHALNTMWCRIKSGCAQRQKPESFDRKSVPHHHADITGLAVLDNEISDPSSTIV